MQSPEFIQAPLWKAYLLREGSPDLSEGLSPCVVDGTTEDFLRLCLTKQFDGIFELLERIASQAG